MGDLVWEPLEQAALDALDARLLDRDAALVKLMAEILKKAQAQLAAELAAAHPGPMSTKEFGCGLLPRITVGREPRAKFCSVSISQVGRKTVCGMPLRPSASSDRTAWSSEQRRSRAHSTSVSVSGRGVRTSLVTLKPSDQNSRSPRSWGSGSPITTWR